MYSINSLLEYFLVVVQFVMNFDLSLFIYLFINKKNLNYINPSPFSCIMSNDAIVPCSFQMHYANDYFS